MSGLIFRKAIHLYVCLTHEAESTHDISFERNLRTRFDYSTCRGISCLQLDIVNFGVENAANDNSEKLEALLNAVNSSDNRSGRFFLANYFLFASRTRPRSSLNPDLV